LLLRKRKHVVANLFNFRLSIEQRNQREREPEKVQEESLLAVLVFTPRRAAFRGHCRGSRPRRIPQSETSFYAFSRTMLKTSNHLAAPVFAPPRRRRCSRVRRERDDFARCRCCHSTHDCFLFSRCSCCALMNIYVCKEERQQRGEKVSSFDIERERGSSLWLP